MNADRLLAYYERIADAPNAIARLRRFILDLAVRGKLVEQDPNDEPAPELLNRIAAEKAERVKGQRSLPDFEADELGDVPRNWCAVPLIALGQWAIGSGFPKNEQGRSEGPYFFLKVSDMNLPENDKYITTANNFIDGDAAKRMKAAIHPAGTIIFPKIGGAIATNKRRILTRGSAVDNNCLGITFSSHINIEWAYLLMTHLDFTQYQAGTAVPALQQGTLATIPIPLPPLAEQHRIVAKVDAFMALCDRLEEARTERETTRNRLAAASLVRLNAPDPDPAIFRNHTAFALENLAPLTTRTGQIKALRQTILNLAVRGQLMEQDPNDEPIGEALERIGIEREGLVQRKIIRREKPLAKIGADEPPFEIPLQWRWKRIGEVALFTQYGTSTKSISSEQGVPVLTMGNIQDGVVVWGNEKKIPATSEEFPALFLKKFDLLYNRTNSAELVGKTGIYLGEDDCKTFASYLIRIQLSKISSSPRYVNLAMNAPVFRETQIVPLIKKQTGQANVNGTALKKMFIPLPPLPEQHRIVVKVDELMILCDRLEASLASGDDTRRRLLDALLQEALTPSTEKIQQDIPTIAQKISDKPPGSPKVLTEPTLAAASPE